MSIPQRRCKDAKIESQVVKKDSSENEGKKSLLEQNNGDKVKWRWLKMHRLWQMVGPV